MTQVALGNIAFYWPKQTVLDFYQQAARSNADHIYLGESVCSKRRELSLGDWLELGQDLQCQGKQVVLSTLALLEAKSELAMLKKACNNGELMVEANDFAAVQLLSEAGIGFVAGSGLNIYNQHDIQQLVKRGMQRWVMPVELSRQWLSELLAQCEALGIRQQFEVEVYGYGFLPLAYAARCFTARSEQRPKDQCQLCCINYPQGREVDSQEGQTLFVLNGIQTLSGQRQNLIAERDDFNGLVDIVRIAPDTIASLDWVDAFKQPEQVDIAALLAREPQHCNGYWHKIEGIKTL